MAQVDYALTPTLRAAEQHERAVQFFKRQH